MTGCCGQPGAGWQVAPTAQAGAGLPSVAVGMAATENSVMSALRRRPGLRVQARPFHRRISGTVWPVLVVRLPAAQALAAEAALAASSTLDLATGSGLGTGAHAVPFQRRISGRSGPTPFWHRGRQVYPTAHALRADAVVMPFRVWLSVPWPGPVIAAGAHLVPFQCRMSGRVVPFAVA